MGTIMAVGIGIANAILIVSFSESRKAVSQQARQQYVAQQVDSDQYLMTSIAMIAGMATNGTWSS
jgi:multidrug efflux pump subunit AcrB